MPTYTKQKTSILYACGCIRKERVSYFGSIPELGYTRSSYCAACKIYIWQEKKLAHKLGHKLPKLRGDKKQMPIAIARRMGYIKLSILKGESYLDTITNNVHKEYWLTLKV